MKLTLLQWHPYSNRQLDVRSTITGYTTSPTCGAHVTFRNINFNRGDDVMTTQVINYAPNASGVIDDHQEYDYLLVSNDDTPSNAVTNTIESRWYVLESKWNRKGQRILTLKRDIVADTWNTVKGDPFYCEKGIVPATDDFIFANEPLQFNKSLSTISLLKPSDETHLSGYAVVYVASNYKGGTYTQEPATTYPTFNDLPSDLRSLFTTPVASKTTCDDILVYISGSNHYDGYCSDGKYRMWECHIHPVSKASPSCSLVVSNDVIDAPAPYSSDFVQAYLYADYTTTSPAQIIAGLNYATGNTPYNTQTYYNSVNEPVPQSILTYDGFVYVIQSGTDQGGWKVTLHTNRQDPVGRHRYFTTPSTTSTGDRDLSNAIQNHAGGSAVKPVSGQTECSQGIYYGYDLFGTTGTRNVFSVGEYTISLPVGLSTVRPYNAFYFEYNANNYELGKVLPRDLADNLYDIQLVAYKPASTKSTTTQIGSRAITLNWIETFKSNYICPITYNPGSAANNVKYHGMTDTIRVVAPDNSAMWEFNPIKAGITSNFNLTLIQDLEPYATQYFITTSLGRLYGNNPQYNTQGLIYQLNCSLPHATSQWESYKANNIAYQNIFNRQIENMEANYRFDMREGGAGAIMSATGMAIAGGMAGGPWGAAIAGGASLAGGIADQFIARDRFKESLDYTRDQYAFNLMNIQSKPNTYSGGSVFQPTNSLFARAELYEATTDEYNAWSKYETYNAWTLNKISTLDTMKTNATTYSAISTFVKGYLCRCSLHEDAHFTNALNDELQRGVYITNVNTI